MKEAEDQKAPAVVVSLHVPRSSELHGVPCMGVVGSYGGGDAFRTSALLFAACVTAEEGHWAARSLFFLCAESKKKIWQQVVEQHEENKKVAQDEVVVRFPCKLPRLEEMEWQVRYYHFFVLPCPIS